ncbi:fimbrial biogenesis chaperone [Pseudoxanthomonas sp. 10H]|uniref:fimbrial biogenesis chaperone n=1 Tax=Pseudoxanthomonas sp. 10H TaxID=3242729 RepID=UPI003557ED9B
MGHWFVMAALALAATVAQAADLQVNPIMVEFTAGEQSQAIWLTNTGTQPLKAQVRVSRWTQADGQDQLAPSRDLVASPAILEVAAGEQQLVRLIRPNPAPATAEMAYRLAIDELPADASAPREPGLQFLLRYSVPVFVLAEGNQPLSPSRRSATTPGQAGVPAGVSASLEPQGETSLLSVANPGGQRIRLSNLAWIDGGGQRTEVVPGLVGYVLAGQRMQWAIPLAPPLRANGGSLKVRFNDDPNDQTLPLETARR